MSHAVQFALIPDFLSDYDRDLFLPASPRAMGLAASVQRGLLPRIYPQVSADPVAGDRDRLRRGTRN